LLSYAFNRSGGPPVDHRSRLGGPCNIPINHLTLCERFPERLPCLVEYLKATQLFPRPYPRITSHVYNIYETIQPLDTTWYAIWANVIVIVATYRRVVTTDRTRRSVHRWCHHSGWWNQRQIRTQHLIDMASCCAIDVLNIRCARCTGRTECKLFFLLMYLPHYSYLFIYQEAFDLRLNRYN